MGKYICRQINGNGEIIYTITGTKDHLYVWALKNTHGDNKSLIYNQKTEQLVIVCKGMKDQFPEVEMFKEEN